MRVTRIKLQEVLDSDEFETIRMTFKSVDQLLDGDLDLSIAELEGCRVIIYPGYVGIDDGYINESLEILNRISSLDYEEHMKLYAKYDKFHDGGDDLDYGGSYVGLLYDLLKKVFVETKMKDLTLKEAKEIEELDLDKRVPIEEQEKSFNQFKNQLKIEHPNWDDWAASYWAITLMKLELAVGGDIVTMTQDSEEEPDYIVIVGKPDYGS